MHTFIKSPLCGILLMAALGWGPLHAQLSLGGGVRAGFSFNGVNVNGEAVDITDSLASRVMLLTGSLNGFLELGIADKVFLQPEIGITQRGWRIGADETLLGKNLYAERLHYLDIPVLLKVAVKSNETQMIALYAGPSFNRLLRVRTEELGAKTEQDLSAGVYAPSEVGIVFGVGAKGKNEKGPGFIVGDVRVSSGTSPFKEITDNGNTLSFTNWTLNFSLGYMFSSSN